VYACSLKSSHATQVDTADAAIHIARQSWESLNEKMNYRDHVYSKQETTKFEPYTAFLGNGIWTVRGTVPPGFKGQMIETTVRQKDGSVSITVVEVK
jgi:hypothetical protein